MLTVATQINFDFVCRFDEDIGRVELDYPRDMAMWKGVGYNIDSVFQWKDGKCKVTALDVGSVHLGMILSLFNTSFLFNSR